MSGLREWIDPNSQFEGLQWVSASDLQQRMSPAAYVRMYELGTYSADDLRQMIAEDSVRYAEEYVLKQQLGQLELQIIGNDLFSPKFGEKTLLQMCKDAVLARESLGVDSERVLHEGLGIANLTKILPLMDEGEVATLVSPADPNDKNMAGYTMIYLYQKLENGKVWFGAVRDEARSLDDWRSWAREESQQRADWKEFDHLRFVASPFVGKHSLAEILAGLGVEKVETPSWVSQLASESARAMVASIAIGDDEGLYRAMDAFKMALIAGKNNENITSAPTYSVNQMLINPEYWYMVQAAFNNQGGAEILRAGGSCGGDGLNSNGDSRQNNMMSHLFGLNESKVETTSSTMECVKCPFCHETVNAIVTSTKIKCPECKAEVSTG